MNTTTLNPDFTYQPVTVPPSDETKRLIIDLTKSIANARYVEGFAIGFTTGVLAAAFVFAILEPFLR